MSPPDFGPFYARHEAAVLRFFMERVRSPELACDLTAETFAVALAETFDPSRESEASWVLSLANAQLLRAYRVGEVDDTARERLRIAPLALDDRTLDRVWQLRGEDRNEERKPRLSGQVMVGEHARLAATGRDDAAARGGVVAADDATGASSAELFAHSANNSALAGGGVMVPAVAGALVGAARRRHGGRRRRRRFVIAARVVVALVTVTWVVGEAVIPDRPAATPGTWLPYETERARGEFPRSWYMDPQGTTFTTFETGSGARCGALATMGASDALVSIVDGRPRPPAETCVRRARVSRRALRDGLWALIVLGPRASDTARREAGEIAARARRPA